MKGASNPDAVDAAARIRRRWPTRAATRRCACSRSIAPCRSQDYADFARTFAGIAKAYALWIDDGRARGIYLTVAGPDGAAIAAAAIPCER